MREVVSRVACEVVVWLAFANQIVPTPINPNPIERDLLEALNESRRTNQGKQELSVGRR